MPAQGAQTAYLHDKEMNQLLVSKLNELKAQLEVHTRDVHCFKCTESTTKCKWR